MLESFCVWFLYCIYKEREIFSLSFFLWYCFILSLHNSLLPFWSRFSGEQIATLSLMVRSLKRTLFHVQMTKCSKLRHKSSSSSKTWLTHFNFDWMERQKLSEGTNTPMLHYSRSSNRFWKIFPSIFLKSFLNCVTATHIGNIYSSWLGEFSIIFSIISNGLRNLIICDCC